MKTARRDTPLIVSLLLLGIGLAVLLRFYMLGSQSLWSDEGNSAALAARSFGQIIRDAGNDIHPPLYYLLLHLWTRLVGDSEAALRSLSAVLGVVLALVTGELGRRICNRRIGLAALFIAALAPFQVYYSQEARMYVLLALEAAAAGLLFWWLVKGEDTRLPAEGEPAGVHLRLLPFSGQLMVLVWAAGLYTHYAFPLVIGLFTLLYAAWLAASRRRGLVGKRLLRWLLLLALAIGLYAPWIGAAVRQLAAWPAVDAGAGLGEQVAVLFRTLALGPLAGELPGAAWLWLMLVVAAVGALPWPPADRSEQAGSPRLDWLRCLTPVAWVLAPVAMILVLGLFREAYLKFLLMAAPAWSILVARGVLAPLLWRLAPATQPVPTGEEAPAPHPTAHRALLTAAIAWAVLAAGAVTPAAIAMLVHTYNDPAAARDDYRGIAQFIMATGDASDAVLLTAPGQEEVFRYYYRGTLPVYPLPRQRPADLAATAADLEALLRHDKVYAVYWALEEADPDNLVRGWMDTHGYKTLDQWHGNVRLAVYVMPERGSPDESVDGLNAALGPAIVLDGYRGWNLTPAAGEVTQLQLHWRAVTPPGRRFKVFLQLLDARDQVIAQRDAEPAGESRPTDSWAAGEAVPDNHGLLIPPGTPPGAYRRIVGMYDPETGERLRLPDGSDFISLPSIQVARSRTSPPLEALNMRYAQSFDFGGITLLGHDRYKRGFSHAADTPLFPGDLLHLTFYWRANVTPRADWWFELSLNDSGGETVAQVEAPLVGDNYLTTLWQEGEVVRAEHDLLIPPELPAGVYRLSLVLLPDTHTPAGEAYLGTVRVQEQP